jgi:hypothetical protein
VKERRLEKKLTLLNIKKHVDLRKVHSSVAKNLHNIFSHYS